LAGSAAAVVAAPTAWAAVATSAGAIAAIVKETAIAGDSWPTLGCATARVGAGAIATVRIAPATTDAGGTALRARVAAAAAAAARYYGRVAAAEVVIIDATAPQLGGPAATAAATAIAGTVAIAAAIVATKGIRISIVSLAANYHRQYTARGYG
jgi:hypothetical protein